MTMTCPYVIFLLNSLNSSQINLKTILESLELAQKQYNETGSTPFFLIFKN